VTETATVPVRTDGRAGWRGASLAGVAFAVTMIGTTLPTPLYSSYAREFGFGELMTTVIFSVYAVGVIAGLLSFGHWSDYVGRRPMLLAGLALSALSAVAFLLPGALAWLFVGRVLSGLSAGLFTGTATAAVVDLAPSGQRARASLLAAAVNMGGLGAGPLLAGILAQYAPLPTRLCFVIDLVLLALGVACVVVVRETVPARDGDEARPLRLRPRGIRIPGEIRGVFTRAAIAGFAGFAVTGLFTAVSPAFLADVIGNTNRAVLGLVVMSVFAASVVGQSASTRAGERAMPVGCVGLILGMALVAASLPAASLPLLALGSVVAGFGQGMSFRAGLASVSEAVAPERRGEVTSTLFVLLYIGISIPVIGEGALATGLGLVSAGVIFAAAVAALAVVALVLLVRQR
jgi:MFS family permease